MFDFIQEYAHLERIELTIDLRSKYHRGMIFFSNRQRTNRLENVATQTEQLDRLDKDPRVHTCLILDYVQFLMSRLPLKRSVRELIVIAVESTDLTNTEQARFEVNS